MCHSLEMKGKINLEQFGVTRQDNIRHILKWDENMALKLLKDNFSGTNLMK